MAFVSAATDCTFCYFADDAIEMQQHTAVESQPADMEAGASSDIGGTRVVEGRIGLPAATAEAAEVPTDAWGVSTEAASGGSAEPPPGVTEDTQPQASSEETSEQPVAETPSLATPEPEATAAAQAAAPVELLDPVLDPELKPASLSSQSEESIR